MSKPMVPSSPRAVDEPTGLTVKERIQGAVDHLKQDTDDGSVEGLFWVQLDRLKDGRLVPTVTVIAPSTATFEEVDALHSHLHSIGALIQAVVGREQHPRWIPAEPSA